MQLVRADDILNEFCSYCGTEDECFHGTIQECETVKLLRDVVDGLERVDAVPVVRCDECIHRDNNNHRCKLHDVGVAYPNIGFCYWGKIEV